MRDIFCVCYDLDDTQKRRVKVKHFCITNSPETISEELNKSKKWHRHRAFLNFYDAQCYIGNLLSFEDWFRLDINNEQDIVLGQHYYLD